jgi:hypothetical protein
MRHLRAAHLRLPKGALMTADTVIPEARLVRLRRSGVVWALDVRCPHCGGQHTHGGGVHAQPLLGHRAAPCAIGTRRGYLIVDPHQLCP